MIFCQSKRAESWFLSFIYSQPSTEHIYFMETEGLENGTALNFHIFMYKVIVSWNRWTLMDHAVSNYMPVPDTDAVMEWFGHVTVGSLSEQILY